MTSPLSEGAAQSLLSPFSRIWQEVIKVLKKKVLYFFKI